MVEFHTTLPQVQGLVQTLVSHYNLPCDRAPVGLSEEGEPFTYCRLGVTAVRVVAPVTQEPNGRFTCKVHAFSATDLLNNQAALVGLLDSLSGMEAFLQKVLRGFRASPESTE
jgi:hypothetical protein